MIKINKTALLIAGAVTLGASSAAFAAPADMDYVKMAGASDQYEIQSSKLLLTSTTNPDLKKFAQMMVSDHMKSTAMVKAAAKKAGMHPMPPMLDSDGKDMIAQLRMAKGDKRDMLYVSQQKMAHDKALALQQDEASTGTTDPLKMAAGNIVPVVQQHESMLSSMPAMPAM